MSPDERTVLLLLVAFATFFTAHVAIVVGLALRPPRWRALAALLVAPLAPYWGARNGMHKRVVLWGVSGAAYIVLRVIASR
jgi:hypothetical protein